MKHLEIIQGVISRLAGNSFSIKGWSVTVVSALFAFAAKESDARYALVAVLPALCFWGLDSYYLRRERLFRELYNAVRPAGSSVPVFSMETKDYAAQVKSWPRTLFSKSIFWLHAPIVAAIIAVILYAVRRG